MSIRDYNRLNNRHLIVTDTTTGNILLNQPIDDTRFSRDTIIFMVKDLIDDVVFFDNHGLNVKIGYKNT